MADTNPLVSDSKPRMFYFGPWDEPGHYFFDDSGRYSEREARPVVPWKVAEIDGWLQPHYAGCKRGNCCGCGGGPEGVALLRQKDGWTALSFWDRSVDRRGACNSTYFAEGTFTFDEMVEMAKTRFAYRWNKMKFPVRLAEDK